jgi:hypothetical protein
VVGPILGHLFEEFLHRLEVIGLRPRRIAMAAGAHRRLLHRGENFDFHHVAHVRVRINRSFAHIARVMKHGLGLRKNGQGTGLECDRSFPPRQVSGEDFF